MKRLLALLLLGLALGTSAQAAAVVNASAQNYNGLADAAGSQLPIGSLIRVGFFNLTDSVILANNTFAGQAFLNSNFVEFGTAKIGDSFPGTTGYFAKSITNTTEGLGLVGSQIYLWVFNAATQAGATQQNIFYLTGSSEWIFKSDDANPPTSNPDLADLTNASNSLVPNAHVVLGGFPGGNSSSVAGARNFNLVTIVPEPTSLLLFGAGALALAARRRRSA